MHTGGRHPEKGLERLEQTCLLIAAHIVTCIFDMNDLAVLEKFGHRFVLFPFIAPGIGFENQCRRGDLGPWRHR